MSTNKNPLFPITGQIIFRDSAQDAPDGSGRKLMAFVGIIAAPKNFELKGEHQYTIVAKNDGSLQFSIMSPKGIDVSNVTVGNSFTGILRAPIWQV